MELDLLLKGIDFVSNADMSLDGIPERDSRLVEKSSVFFCISGFALDGHDFASSALEKGAVAVVVERDLGLKNQIIVKNTLVAYSLACANYFGNPAEKLKLIGVTGTNGKTTVSFITRDILTAIGKKVGLIGTVKSIIGDMEIPARYSTPDPFILHSLFARMVEADCEYVVMEVTSHGLDQHRVEGCKFLASAFTNLTQDHLDYHKTMDNYFAAKKKLFEISENIVLNLDDKHGRMLLEQYPYATTYSCDKSEATISAHNIRFTQQGSTFALLNNDELKRVSFIQPGLFSVSNAMAAAGLCLSVGLSFEQVTEGLNHCKGVPGRFEVIPANTSFTVVRDYAHSPDGLEKMLSTAKEFATGRIITLFGCPGVRDRSKRHAMAEAVAKYTDIAALTSDNPRTESAQQIIDDAVVGFKKYPTVKHVEFIDRLEAIKWVLEQCRDDDLLILAGKGHEDYQVLDYGTVYFDEREIVLDLVGSRE